MLLFSMSGVFAQNNETLSDDVSATIEQDDVFEVPQNQEVLSVEADEPVIAESNNGINIHVVHHYNETSKTWDEDGFNLAGATVNLYDSSNTLVKTLKTDSKGLISFKNLNSSKYHVEVSYSTYEPITSEFFDFSSQSGTANAEFRFVPDILLLVDYNSHNEKVDLLMNMSKRIAFISTTDYDKSREWLAGYANFIHVDMFAEGRYSLHRY